MRRSIDPMCVFRLTGSRPKPASRTIVSMSLRPAIPWRVGLHQSPPPLHQPMTILAEMRYFEKKNSLNGKCRNSVLSQPKGSPQFTAGNKRQHKATDFYRQPTPSRPKNRVVEHKGEHTLPSKRGVNDRPLSHLAGVRERRRRMTGEHGAVFALSGKPGSFSAARRRSE